ncbi:MAG TPA: hypothetical protein VN649_05855 [Ramlibacter sp.]|nr:hypothetical protein [Ramlibacter sp.]
MRLLLLCAALVAAPAIAGDLVARQGSDTIRLADEPCTSQQVLGRLEARFHSQYKAATAVVQGQSFSACWRPAGRAVHLVYEDGDQGILPLEALKAELTA